MAILDDILNTIIETVDPEKVVLFGSRAVGRARDDSDYDFMVIKSDITNEREVSRKIYRELYNRKINDAVDIIVVDKEKFNKNKENPYLIYSWADKEGKLLYG